MTVRWVVGMAGLVACQPTTPFEPKDTGYRLALDSAAPEDSEWCRPVIPAPTVVVTAAQTLGEPGTYLVCPMVPVTATADETTLFVSQYATATVTGDKAVVYAQAGSQVHASGDRSVVVAEVQAQVSVALASSGVERCASLRWGPTWDEACP